MHVRVCCHLFVHVFPISTQYQITTSVEYWVHFEIGSEREFGVCVCAFGGWHTPKTIKTIVPSMEVSCFDWLTPWWLSCCNNKCTYGNTHTQVCMDKHTYILVRLLIQKDVCRWFEDSCYWRNNISYILKGESLDFVKTTKNANPLNCHEITKWIPLIMEIVVKDNGKRSWHHEWLKMLFLKGDCNVFLKMGIVLISWRLLRTWLYVKLLSDKVLLILWEFRWWRV